jgi:hypothetical protein
MPSPTRLQQVNNKQKESTTDPGWPNPLLRGSAEMTGSAVGQQAGRSACCGASY